MRGILIGACALLSFAATTAQACSMVVPPASGETQDQAYERVYLEAQTHYWTEADFVFIGEVESLRRNNDQIEVEVSARYALKGGLGRDLVRYTFDKGADFACGFVGFPEIGSFGVFYAARQGDRIVVRRMLLPGMIKDNTLRERVLIQVDAIERGPMQQPSPKSTVPDWAPTAAMALLSALFGLFAGRAWGRRSMRKRLDRS